MKIEKLTENKIQVTLTIDDLRSHNINLFSFMSNSTEAQTLLLNLLTIIEQKHGFKVRDHKINVETIAISENTFIITITRLNNAKSFTPQKKLYLHTKRKLINIEQNEINVFIFNDFEDYCSFCKAINTSSKILLNIKNALYKNSSLFLYNDNYYLLINKPFLKNSIPKYFFSLLNEFSKFVGNSNVLEAKIKEFGKPIMRKNAIATCLKYF